VSCDGHAAAREAVRAASRGEGHLTYEQALTYVIGLTRFGTKLGLERSHAIMAALGDPARGKRGALIAGTNGKGSTSAFLEAILRARGLHTGMTPSPHLKSYTERVQVDGQPVSEAEFAAAVEQVLPDVARVTEEMGEPTEFELLIGVAMAWLAPRAERLVIEVGMGGRYDSTNVLDLGLSIVTNVDYDHQRYLGNTVEEIATEKAGIIKPGNLVLTGAEGPALAVVERRAAEVDARLWRLGQEIRWRGEWRGWEGSTLTVEGPGFEHRDLPIRLLGSWQPANAALAVAAAHALGDATDEAVAEGLRTARWPGRLHPVAPDLLLDGGHNPAGLRRVVPDVVRLAEGRRLALVLAVMSDKELPPMLAELRRLEPEGVVCTAAATAGSRAMRPERLAEQWGERAEPVLPVAEALRRAREIAGDGGLVLACGSLYLVGELLP
jgi:dihydrofolate synthase / folylpolyglutamate synthase